MRCAVCKDRRIDAINLACVEGQGTQAIAKDFGISRTLIEHHRASGHAARAITKAVLDAHSGPMSDFANICIANKLRRVQELDVLYFRLKEEISAQTVGNLDPKLVREAVGLLATAAKEMGEWRPDGGEQSDAATKLAQSIVIHAASSV